ncbi:MAG TPA: 30S ribosomal protein S1, partial [Actinomycetes bacterium]|nr:30S ribosomal protein S1 [Actinomycetes bacterium]
TLYGMSASYDEAGNYQYPDGFDPETNEWLPGHETQQAEWERQYAEARVRYEAHMKQVTEAAKAEAEANLESGSPSTYSSEAAPEQAETGDSDEPAAGGGAVGGGTLASDEALAALREKLTGDK